MQPAFFVLIKIVSGREEFHVHSWVYMINAAVRHVLKAHAQGEVIRDSPIQANVAGELKIIAEIPGAEAVPAQKSWSGAAFECDWKPPFAQFNQRAN